MIHEHFWYHTWYIVAAGLRNVVGNWGILVLHGYTSTSEYTQLLHYFNDLGNKKSDEQEKVLTCTKYMCHVALDKNKNLELEDSCIQKMTNALYMS